MATVIVHNVRSGARAPRSKLYVALAFMITAIVFAGFSPSFYGTVITGIAHPWIIHVHAVVYVGWLALLIAQSVLAARGKIALHRRVGRVGIAYGALVFGLGVIVSFAMPVINVHAGVWSMQRAETFLAAPLGDMVLFGSFFGAAIVSRRHPAIHKRFIVLAAVAVMYAAVGRALTVAGALFDDPTAAAYVGGRAARLALWYSPVLVAIAHDFVTKRRVHPVYGFGVVVMAVAFLRVPYSQTEQWRAIARAMLAPFM